MSEEQKVEDIQAAQLSFLKAKFSIEDVFSFCLKHRVEVIKGEDHQYHCLIDYKAGDGIWAAELDPLTAMCVGIEKYKSMALEQHLSDSMERLNQHIENNIDVFKRLKDK